MKKKLTIIKDSLKFNPDPEKGLSAWQVQQRIEREEVNTIHDENEKTYGQIIFGNVFTFFNILLVAIAVCLIVFVGFDIIFNLSFILIATVNTLIGTIQECQSKKAIKKLKLLNASKNTVVRDSIEYGVLSEDIVLEDIVILKAGDEVPVDCRVISDRVVEVNESLLTGESKAVKKYYDDTLLAGSSIVSGSCKVIVEKIGTDTYIHSVEAKAKGFKKPKSKLMVGINRVIKILASIAVPLACVVFINQMLGGIPGREAAKYALLVIPYMVPVGMVLLTSIAMTTGIIVLSKKKVLANDLYSVEALSRIDTLCLDKTGTITDGTMKLEKTIVYGAGDITDIISSYLGAFESRNQTAEALINSYGTSPVYKVLNKIEFSSDRKYSAVEFKDIGTYILGAPEYLTDDEDILHRASEFADVGLRVVLMKKVPSRISGEKIDIRKGSPFVMFVIRDNIRPEVPDTMKWFAENDVDIKIISGDNVKTVAYIAAHCGIKNADKYIDMSTVSENDFERAVLDNTVFGRVTPEQKAQIVDVLKSHGKQVAMTGDGVNDIIALKKADCSIALANGAPATKNVSNLVLLDSNFENMKEAVFEGRRVVNNVQRSSVLFVMKDFLWLFVNLLPLIVGGPYIFEPTIMTIVNTIICGIGSVFIALEPDKSRIKGDFIKTVLGRAITAGFFMFLPVIMTYVYSIVTIGFDISAVSTFIQEQMLPVVSICITIAGFIIFYDICRPFTKYRRGLYTALLLITALLLLAIPELFLMNGTDFVAILVEKYGTSVIALIKGIIHTLFTFEIYKTFSLSRWIMIAAFLLLSNILYRVTGWGMNKLLNSTMFSENRFKDQD